MSGRRARSARQVSRDDQAQAAREHADRTVCVLAQQTPGVTLTRTSFPFAQDAAGRAQRALHTGAADPCPHLDPARPDVWHIFAHAPQAVQCVQCAVRRARSLKGTVEDRTCDRCRDVDPVGVYPGVMSVGPLLVSFGLCSGCRESHLLRRSA